MEIFELWAVFGALLVEECVGVLFPDVGLVFDCMESLGDIGLQNGELIDNFGEAVYAVLYFFEVGHLVVWIMLLIFVVRKVTIYIMTFLKRIISGFVCSRVRGSLRCYRRVFSSWRAGAHRVSRVEDTCVRWRSVSWIFLRFR